MRALLLVICVWLSALPAAAVEWRQSRLWGGDVRSLVFDPADAERVLAGTSSGQVFVSDNGGESWLPAGQPVAFPGWVVSELMIDSQGVVWAALWGLWGDGGTLYRSTDGGVSWQERAAGLPGSQVYRLAEMTATGRLFAATRGGVYGSDDRGLSWRHLTAALPQIEKVSSLLVDGTTVLAGTWQRAYKSEDGGESWRGVFRGMILDSEVFSLKPGPEPEEVWASTCGWVYRSADGGESWRRYQKGMDERRTQALGVLPSGRLLAGTVAGVYVSDDGGLGWSIRTSPELVVATIANHPERPELVLVGTEGSGIWRSEDGAESFRRASHGLTGVRVADMVRLRSGELLAAVRHGGPASGIYSSRDGGLSFDGPQADLPTVLELAAGGDRPYAATEKGLFERRFGEWRAVAEIGFGRVDEVAAEGELVVALAGGKLYRRHGETFVPLETGAASARSVSVVAGEIWVGGDGDGLWRWSERAAGPAEAPFSGGRLGALADSLVLAGDGGAWLRHANGGAWQPLVATAAAGLPTGDAAYPLLVLARDGGVRLLERDRLLLHPLSLPVPARDLSAAALIDGRLVLATVGYGVVWARLADLLEPGDDPWARLTSR